MTLMTAVIAAGWLVATPEKAHAQNGFWHWGPPGFSHGHSPEWRMQKLLNEGLADPMVDYYTPFWRPERGSEEIGYIDKGYRNEYSINHDINAAAGIPLLGYIDVVTPLFGTNELAIAATVASVWNSIVDTVSSAWNWVTSAFSSRFTSYVDTGGYSGGGGFDNAFIDSYSDWSMGGGDCLRAPDGEQSLWLPNENCP